MFRLPPDPGNPDAQAKGLAPQRASAAPSRGAGSFIVFEHSEPNFHFGSRNRKFNQRTSIDGNWTGTRSIMVLRQALRSKLIFGTIRS